MSDDQRTVRALPAQPLDDLLASCVAAQVRAARGEPVAVPRVTLHLSSGRDVVGEVINLHADRRGPTALVMVVAIARGDASPAAAYVPLSTIEAVSVHEAARHAALLSWGQVSGPLEEAPTRLEARRRLEQHRKEASAAAGLELTWVFNLDQVADGEPLRGVVDLSADAVATVKAVASDELGRRALAEGVTAVSLEDGPEASVALREKRLVFVAPWARGRPARLSLKELKVAVDALL
jgi:hypothetical protein